MKTLYGPRSTASDLGLNLLFRSVCPKTYDYYRIIILLHD